MKRIILILCFFLFVQIGFSQSDINDTSIYDYVEVMPQFMGGESELNQFLFSNYKTKDVNCYVTYIILNFVIEKDGSITNKIVEIEDNYIHILENEVFAECRQAWIDSSMQLLNQMPNWKPGMQNGKLVRVRYRIPVHLDYK